MIVDIDILFIKTLICFVISRNFDTWRRALIPHFTWRRTQLLGLISVMLLTSHTIPFCIVLISIVIAARNRTCWLGNGSYGLEVSSINGLRYIMFYSFVNISLVLFFYMDMIILHLRESFYPLTFYLIWVKMMSTSMKLMRSRIL